MADPATVDWAALAGGAASLATGIGLWLQNRATAKKIDANTEITQQAKDAAEQTQAATVDRLDYDRLRRMEAALLTLEACEPCREAILALTDRRRTRRAPTPPKETSPQ